MTAIAEYSAQLGPDYHRACIGCMLIMPAPDQRILFKILTNARLWESESPEWV